MVRTRVDSAAGVDIPVVLCSSTRCSAETRDSDRDRWIWFEILNLRREIHACCSPSCLAVWAVEQLPALLPAHR